LLDAFMFVESSKHTISQLLITRGFKVLQDESVKAETWCFVFCWTKRCWKTNVMSWMPARISGITSDVSVIYKAEKGTEKVNDLY